MKLTAKGVKNKRTWMDAGYSVPMFDEEEMRRNTRENPVWIHFGNGNIFKALQAAAVQKLLNEGRMDRGLILAGSADAINNMNRLHDEYTILATLHADGSIEKTLIGSIAESCIADAGNEMEYQRLKEIFRKDSLQMVSFTITEKGYGLKNGQGAFTEETALDMEAGPDAPKSYMGMIAALLYERYLVGAKPIAMVSFDNCSHNGDKLYEAILPFVLSWTEKGLTAPGFAPYVRDREKVSFPWTMIDKITPRPDDSIACVLKKDGIEDLGYFITKRNTFLAPFVNAEAPELLVIEDNFPNGRPPLEKSGMIFTERETVDKVEKMKVCACLNPLHTALAIFGCLLGYEKIADEMADEDLAALVRGIGYKEGLPVATDPRIINPKEFLDEVIQVRLPNPFIPDSPRRIASDTSQKLPVRFGETIKKYREDAEVGTADLTLIPLVFAGWLRYLMGVDDEGRSFELSPDPMADVLCPLVSTFRFGQKEGIETVLEPILRSEEIFGVDLYCVGLAERVRGYFVELMEGPGAVRRVLKKYLK